MKKKSRSFQRQLKNLIQRFRTGALFIITTKIAKIDDLCMDNLCRFCRAYFLKTDFLFSFRKLSKACLCAYELGIVRRDFFLPIRLGWRRECQRSEEPRGHCPSKLLMTDGGIAKIEWYSPSGHSALLWWSGLLDRLWIWATWFFRWRNLNESSGKSLFHVCIQILWETSFFFT